MLEEVAETLARDDGPHGSVALRRRRRADRIDGADVYELIVNAAFVMDTVDTSTERLLATATLERLDTPSTILVGGLGLGFTVQALLADARVRRIDVVEMDRAVVDWVRAGLIPHTAGVLRDERVRTEIADVREYAPELAADSYDAILLDVDNGPDFLVHEANGEVYRRPFLSACARAVRPGGVLGVWSADPATPLHRLLTQLFGDCAEVTRTVHREGRSFDYFLYLAQRT